MSLLKSRAEARFTENRKSKRDTVAWPLRICTLTHKRKLPKAFVPAKIKNVSEGGVKITLLNPLEKDAHVLLELDPEKIKKYTAHRPILRIAEDKIMAQIAWRKLNLNTGLFEAGLRFIEEQERQDVELLVEDALSVSELVK